MFFGRPAIQAVGLALLMVVAATPANAQDESEKEPDARSVPTRRMVYVAKNIPSTELAKAIQQLLTSDRTTTLALAAEPVSNCLLYSGSEQEVIELGKILEQLDRKPQQITLTVRILELNNPGSDDIDAQLQGETTDVAKRIQFLQREGQISLVNEVRLAALENQAAMVQTGETVPRTTGFSAARGGATRTISNSSIGTMVRATCRVAEGTLVLADISVEKSYVGKVTEGVVIGKNSDGSDVRSPITHISTSQSTLRIASGRTVALNGVRGANAAGRSHKIWVLVSAKVDP